MSESVAVQDVARYRPSRGLQGILGITFFFITLFLVNALAGAIWLATHNLQVDSLIFLFMFVTGAVLLLYAGIFLFSASHSEVVIGPEKATFVLPNWRGPTPMFPYTECEIPYSELAAVETRGEVYRYFVIPVIVQSASLVCKNGKRLTLGYIRDNPSDPSMPYHTIAEEIAERAGVPLIYKGIVEGNMGLRALIQDEPAWDAPEISEERLQKLRKAESIGWKFMILGLVAIAVTAVGYQASRMFA